MNRLILLVESRIRGDVYVRFGGELPKTHRSNTAGRWMLSLPRLYEKAGKTYKELYECCFTDKDKAIALYSLSQDLLTSNKDSLIALKHKSFEYAKKSKDSAMIAITALNLSFENSEEEIDKSLHYAQLALKWLPNNKERNSYYANLGDIWFRKEEYDSATHYLNKSLGNF